MSEASHRVVYRVMDARKNYPRREIDVRASTNDVAALVDEGFLVGKDWFPKEQLVAFRDALDRLDREELRERDNRVDGYGGWRYFRYLLDKDPAFLSLLTVTVPMTIAQAVLGPQVRLDHVDGKYGRAATAGQFVPWHVHHRVVPDPLPPLFCYPHAIHCLLYLDDADETNGCLCVVPGSHRRPYEMYVQDEHNNRPDQVMLPVGAGTCVLIHANLLHRVTSSRIDGGPRRLLIFGYLPAWMKAGEHGSPPFVRPTDELRRSGSQFVRELLGEFFWG